MGVSTDGQLAYGFIFEDGYEFPWNEIRHGDIEEWWLKECGFKPTTEIYNEDGSDYKDGVKPSESVIHAYYEEKRAFMREHPLPVTEVNYCSGEYPMYMLAVPGSVHSARRGYPERITEWPAIEETEGRTFIAFVEKYDLKPEGEIGWYLSSYWG